MPMLSFSFGERSYPALVERGALNKAGELFDLKRRVLILSDDLIPTEYINKAASFAKEPRIVILPHGEGAKSPENAISVIKTMLDLGFDRGDAIVAVGGGVIGDIGGFVAATYMRGIEFYNIPTSLLAQVDASVGGKVAVDFDGYKNVIGTFYQPKAVLVDPDLLKTLPGREFSAGMAEIIKMFAVADREMFEKLEKSDKLDEKLLDAVIVRALEVKKRFVEADEIDGGERAALNFGHTVGHAVESVAKNLLHGECVGIGMLSLTDGKIHERIKRLLEKYSLPTSFVCDEKAFYDALSHDKKSLAGGVKTVRVTEIGKHEFKNEKIDDILKESRKVIRFI